MVHRFLAGFDLRFVALRRRGGDGPEARGGPPIDLYPPGELGAFLDAADILIASLPSTPATRGLVGREGLARLGPSGLLVNVGRGDTVDEDALFDALEAGDIAGAAIDVWYEDHPSPDAAGRRYPYRRPFHRLPNVVLSPHRGASPLDDLERWEDVIENLSRLARGSTDLLNRVDFEAGY
jgi:phosphoglycerate dehydrogenase-like enzyme